MTDMLEQRIETLEAHKDDLRGIAKSLVDFSGKLEQRIAVLERALQSLADAFDKRLKPLEADVSILLEAAKDDEKRFVMLAAQDDKKGQW
jgi:hypothetical protein